MLQTDCEKLTKLQFWCSWGPGDKYKLFTSEQSSVEL